MPDYDFYVQDFLGEEIPREAFPRLIRRASELLERYRQMFTVTPREGFVCAEECALCAIAEAMYAFDQEDSRRGLAGASVGSVTMDNSLLELYRIHVIDADTAVEAAIDQEYVRNNTSRW